MNELQEKQINVKFIWIPSHCGITGNEQADKLAKAAANKPIPDVNIKPTIKDIYNNIEQYIDKEWQKTYNTVQTGKSYKTLEPTVSRKIKYTNRNRHKETTITRLRLGKCHLKHYLYKIKRHPTGHCEHCNVPETIEHFLLHCQYSAIFNNTTVTTVKQALTSSDNIDKIYSRLQQLNRRI